MSKSPTRVQTRSDWSCQPQRSVSAASLRHINRRGGERRSRVPTTHFTSRVYYSTYLSASIIAMRALALTLLAAITMMHMTHALPHPDLAVRQDGNDLSNESHIFHHLDRNQRTANRDRERLHKDDTEGSGLSVAKRVSDRPQRAGMAMERVADRRFIQSPDYSQSDSGGGPNGSNSASSASDTMPTQKPSAKAEKRPTAMGDP